MTRPAWASWPASALRSRLGRLEILKDAGLDQRSDRPVRLDPALRQAGPTWRQFLSAQAQVILAVDLAHVDSVFLRL